jgi:formamidopyrimidine-DNA glycosylase
MPELPEVETMCRGIAPIVGRFVLRLERPACRRKPIAIRPRIDHFRRRTEGKTIAAVQRVGKRVVIWLRAVAPQSSVTAQQAQGPSRRRCPQPLGLVRDGTFQTPGEEAIVIEPRMTGLVLLADPPTTEHLRFRIELATGKSANRTASRNGRGGQLLFWDRRGLGSVRLLSAAEFAAKFWEHGTTLGPDALSVSPSELKSRLCRSRRPIKVALLDQRAIAGVGNLYASEMLHAAAIHPAMRCDRLRAHGWERLHAALVKVLNEAIRYEGSTLSDGTYRNALNESGGYQNHHRVYDRAGQDCPTCHAATVRRIVQAQRSTFFCPVCQRR